jgi:Arc/MetJ-type ribon-helix-helix transcriptional regulator
MPAVSFYLPEKILKELRSEARTRKTSVSRFIRTAVETQLDIESKNKAKQELVKRLREAELGSWDDLHAERTKEADDRG